MVMSLWHRKIFTWLLQGVLILSLGMRTSALSAEMDYLAAVGLEKIEGKVPAPSFSLPDLQGKAVSLENLRGKGLMLYFWATW